MTESRLNEIAAAALSDGDQALAASRELFRDWVEPLADSFTAEGVRAYVAVFSRIIERAMPHLKAAQTAGRYERISKPRRWTGRASDVVVLSRVTLGADIAVTSVILDAARQAFPDATLYLAGNRKNAELFAAEPRLRHLDLPYARSGALRERLEASAALAEAVPEGALVIDPDSRLSQLGLIPVCPEEHYLFFETRSLDAPGTLGELTAAWCEATLGVRGKAWIAPLRGILDEPRVCVSFGTGGNPDKGFGPEFESGIVRHIASHGLPLLIDRGMGGEEGERVERAIGGVAGVETWLGAFAPFAYEIARAPLYVGYDSSGQHAAAASGTPLVCAFQGAVNERFYERWRPHGPGATRVVRGSASPLEDACRAIDELISLRAS